MLVSGFRLARFCGSVFWYRRVGDHFSIEYVESAEHAMTCFGRLVRAVLGADAIAESKLAFGAPLHLLGLKIAIRGGFPDVKLTRESENKRAAIVERILAEQCVTRREADQLAGRMSSATQCIIFKLGERCCGRFSPINPPNGRIYTPWGRTRDGSAVVAACSDGWHLPEEISRRVVRGRRLVLRRC